MSDNPSPFEIHPDEHIEARITAWVLGEASPFEAAELEALVENSPELKLFHNRIRTLHTLLPEAEDHSGTGDEEWKLPPKKKIKLTRLLGGTPEIPGLPAEKESRIRRASFRAAFAIAACVVVTFFIIRLVPRDHEAEVTLEVRPLPDFMRPLGQQLSDNSGSPNMTSQFFGTEFEKIKSRNSLERVVDNLDLTTRWNTDKESALKKLRDSIKTENIRGTDLISIRVRNADEEVAQQISLEVAEGYRDYRKDLEEKSLAKNINELKKAVREQEDKVEERRKVLTTISRTKDIVYYGDRNMGGRGGMDEDQGAADSLGEFNRLAGEKIQLETQIESLLKYDDEQLKIYASGLDLPDNIVKTLYPQQLELKFQTEKLKASGLAENDPTIQTNQRVLDSMEEQLDEGVVNLRTRLQGQLETSKERLAKVEVQKDESKRDSLERSIDTQDYVDAKRDFQTDQALLEQMKLNLVSKEIERNIIADTIVVTPSFQSDPGAESPQRKQQAPSSALGKAIASTTDTPASIPVPDLAAAEASQDFGNGDDFGDGWGDKGASRDDSLAANQPSPAPKPAASTAAQQIHIGGQVRTPGPQGFQEGLTLGEAVASAGGATEFGSAKRVKVYRDGKATTYDLSKDEFAQVELKPGDTIEMPQKNWMGCGASRDELARNRAGEKSKAANDSPAEPAPAAVEENLQEAQKQEEIDLLPRLSGEPEPGERQFAAMDAAEPSPTPTAKPSRPAITAGNRSLGNLGMERKTLEDRTEETIRNNAASDGKARGLGMLRTDNSGRADTGEGPVGGKGLEIAAKEIEEVAKQDAMATLLDSQSEMEPQAPASQGLARMEERLGEVSDSRNKFKEELGYLDDPVRTNPALSFDHDKNVDEVRRKLYMAQGNFDLGKFDKAKETYEDALRIDPDNSAARRGMEKIAAAKSDYARVAYDQTRAELLMQVDKDWELSVPPEYKWNSDISPQPESGWTSRFKTYSGIQLGDLDGFDGTGSPIAAPENNDVYGQARAGVNLNPSFNDIRSEGEKNWKLTERFSGGFDSDGSKKARTYAFYDDSASTGQKFNMNLRAGAERAAESEEHPRMSFEIDTNSSTFEPLELPALWKELNGKSSGGGEYEIHTGYTNEYLFRGPDLGGDDKVLPEIDLADLSQEIPATQEPFSTFSLNISDASFQIARAAIEKGERPDPASIKPEQFYNAIDYGDPAPSSREPVAAAIDQTAHPVIPGRNLVRIAVRTASTGRSAAQPLRLTLLVDQSGSMVREDRRAAMETALEQLATLLTEQDRITVIGFSRTPRLLADSLPGNQANKLPELINQTANEGGTNLEQAINLASELALRHKLPGAQNRIVLFTDGAANLGNANPERLSEKIETLRQQGLAFDIAGIGTNDLNDNLLAELARHGNGRYYLVGGNTGSSLAAQLAGAFRPAAENVKVQVKFNPERVGNYKLIGFEKDRLKTEDFRNDSIDAAELAADEAGVAMYQVETLPEGSGEIGEVSVRFRDTASGEMVERTWTVAYDPTTPAFDKADPKTQLATLSLLAAQELQGGPLADAIHLGNFAETIARLRQAYKSDPKTQQLLNLVGALK